MSRAAAKGSSSIRAALLAAATILASSAVVAQDESAPSSPWVSELVEVWETVREHFYDPALCGLDWERVRQRYEPIVREARDRDTAAAAINAMLGQLETSHTRYFTDDDPAYYFLLDLFRDATIGSRIPEQFPDGRVHYVGIGVFTAQRDEGVFVKAVVHGGPADRAGLLAGDRLLSVEGQPWHPIRPFRGRAGRPTRVLIQRTPAPDSIVEKIVEPEAIAPVEFYLQGLRASARTLEAGGKPIAYVRVWSWAGRQNQEALEELVLFGPLAGAEALIVDLRDGWGGASPRYLNLFNPRLPTMTSFERDGPPRVFSSGWHKPAALLVNEGTRSGKEVVAYGFQHYGYGPVIGTRTAGAVTAGGCFPIGKRAMLYLARRDILVDGVRLEGVGVRPDLEVPFPLPYAAGRDPQLQRALSVLREELSAP